MSLYYDSETYCPIPIKSGTYIYAASCEVDIVSYAFDFGPINVWDVASGAPMPGDLAMGLEDEDEEIVAHNAMFDRTVLALGNKRIRIPIRRWRCTMVGAYAHSLPGALGKLCEVLKVDADKAKQKRGKALMQLFCKPHKQAVKNGKALMPIGDGLYRATGLTHPDEWAEYLDYAKHDISAMREVDRKLPKWNSRGAALALWHLDQKINDRGFCVDVDFARSAMRAVDRAKRGLKKRTQELTEYNAETGAGLESTTQRDQMLRYLLAEHGVMLPDLQKDTIERRLNDNDIPPELRELLALRLDATTTSTSKYPALLKSVSADGRLRGTKQFAGAGRTGRWAGRVFQPDNLPRPKHEQPEIEEFIAATKIDAEDLYTDDVMGLASSSLRGTIIAPPGKKLVVADLSNIEGRVAAWLAGEEWKLDAFRAFDAGKGPDLYKVAYASAFKMDPTDVDKGMRQIGKVMELMLQYEGGVGAWVTGAATYGIDLDAMAEGAWDTIPRHIRDEAEDFLRWMVKEKRPTFGLSDKVFIVCDSFKRLWRAAHPAITSYWPQLKETVIEAILRPGNTLTCRRVKIRTDGAWLRIQLPTSHSLCYPSPRVKNGVISYMGMNQYTKAWSRIPTYGGKILENITQALGTGSGGVLGDAMPRAEDAGYELVMHTHDELNTEVPDSKEFSVEGLSAILTAPMHWSEGLPLAAAGMETYRYRKE